MLKNGQAYFKNTAVFKNVYNNVVFKRAQKKV